MASSFSPLLLLCSALLLLLMNAPGSSASWINKWKQQKTSSREEIRIDPLLWESTAKGTIDLNGRPFHIKGINWNGLELPRPIISGLEERRMGDLLDILERQNFNAIRMPLSYEVIKHMDEAGHGVDRNYVDPELRGKTLFQVLDSFVTEAGKRGILIMYDMHEIDPMKGFDPLWYTDTVSEADVNRAMSKVVGRYERFWNFFAIDLKNEPHGDSSWGNSNPRTDFNKYAERTIVRLHQEHPSWTGLFVVEGVGDHADADYHSPYKSWWGENVEGVFKFPINTGATDLNKRIVYSPRIYGPDVYDMEYFSDPQFPDRLFEVWDNQLAYLERTTGRAAIMGEYGGSLEDKDRIIQEQLVKWMVSRCIDDGFWWVFNPGSTDIPDGVMKADWQTLDQNKLDLINYVQPTPSKIRFNKNSIEVDRGAPRNAQCADGPTDAIRPTPMPSAAPNSYRPDPFDGMPPGTTSQDIRRMRREQKQKQGSGVGNDHPHA